LVKQKGGEKLKKLLRTALKNSRKEVQYGFFENSNYDDGTPAATVAAANEFGTSSIPERPFFRQANKNAEAPLKAIMRADVDPRLMIISTPIANKLGLEAKAQVQEDITDLRSPPKAESTLRQNPDKTNPLIVTGFMRRAVDYTVDE